MSSPATTAFLAAWRNNARRSPVVLARIAITSPSAATMYVATREVTTPDGQTWEAGLRFDGIRHSISRLDPGPAISDTTIYLANRTYATLAGDRLDAQTAAYQFQGATVDLWFWDDQRDSTGAQVLAWADALCVFAEGRIDSYDLGDSWVRFTVLQDQSWNNRIPTTVVDAISYPNAPDISQGRPVPIVYGDFRALPMRSPWTATYTDKDDQENAGAGLGVVPMLLVDPGLGAANVKLVAAAHECKDILSRSTGYSQFIAAGDVLAPLNTAGITETLGSSESYITINDDTLIAYYGVRPLEPRATYNTADNARRAADPFNETTYASIDQNTSKNVVELTLPTASPLGFIETVAVEVAFIGNAGNGSTLRVRPQIPGGANGTAVTATLADSQSTTPKILTGAWDTGYWTQNWQFGGTSSGSPWDIRIDFTGGTTNRASILWAVLKVKFRPQRNLVTPAYVANGFFAGAPIPPASQALSPSDLLLLGAAGSRFNPAQLSQSGQFFANIKGYPDDGSGTYTGSAAALIERPCDIVRHLLETYGGLSSGDFETGATSFGSFVHARDLLRNAEPSDFKLACWIGEKTSVQQAVVSIASQSLGLVLMDRFSGKWHFHVWRRGPAADYALSFTRNECPDLFEASVASDVSLAQGVRVQWGWDAFRNRSLFETFVNSDGSSQGYALPSVRDQLLVVTAGTNDDLDWSKGASTYADVLTPGTYTPIELAAEMQTQMRTHSTEMHVGHGFTIATGYNDALDYVYSAVTYAATLNPGEYTADELAAEVVRAIKATSGGSPTCTYDQSTNQFTIGGGISARPRGANVLTSGWYTLGMMVGGVTYTGIARYAGRFWWTNEYYAGSTAFKLLWGTGASSATCCAHLVGESNASDADAFLGYWSASLARGNREAACAASEATYGPRADRDFPAPWVRDESSAQRLRDGIFDFGATPPVRLKFRSHACPDIRLMQTFECSADMDARRPYPGYGSDGSWGGKVMRVMEIHQAGAPSYHTEVLAEDA